MGFVDHVACEVDDVGLALQAHQVVGKERTHQPLMLRQRREDERRRNGHMQEKSDALAATQRTQLRRQRDQVVVVHPDHVVLAQQRQQLAREHLVHAAVALAVIGAEVGQVQPVVQHRPQHAVGVALVIGRVVRLAQVHGGQGHVAGLVCLQRTFAGRAVRGDRAAPAEPQAARACQRVAQGHGQATGSALARVGQAVGDDDESAHAGRLQVRSRCPRGRTAAWRH